MDVEQKRISYQARGLDDVWDTMPPAERHQVGTLAAVFHLANQFAADFYGDLLTVFFRSV